MWNEATITNAGLSVYNRWLGGEALTLTGAKGGDRVTEDPAAATDLVQTKQTLSLIGTEAVSEGQRVKVQAVSAGLETGYTLRQVGIWGRIGGGTPVLLILLQDEDGVPIPGEADNADFRLELSAFLQAVSAGSFSAVIDPAALVSVKSMQAALNDHNSAGSSHADLRAEDALLQAQIDQLVAPTGEAPSAAEVENARVGADATVYPTLGEAVRGQVSELKSALDQNYDLTNIGDYVNGSYTNAGVLTSGNTTRVRFNRFILLHAGDSIRANVPTGLQITISRFNATTKELIKEGWTDTNPYTAKEDVLILPVWKKSDNTAITPTEIGVVYINHGIESIVNSINKSTSEEYVFSEYVNGTFQDTGKLTLRDDRIRFGNRIFLRAGDAVHFSAFTGQWHGYSTWKKDPTADYGYTLIKDYTLNGVIADEETISFDEDCYFIACYGETGSTDFPVANLGIITTVTRRLTYDLAYDRIKRITDPRKTYDFKGFTMGGNIVAHRGEPYAENTMLALKRCIANGTNVLEIDLAFTSDNIPVLLHDTTINRTGRNTDGTTIAQTINIADITYQQALQYDFGIWKGSEYAGQKIPTLKEALLLFKRKNCCGIIDLTGHSYTSEQYDIMHDIFSGTGMIRNVAINASTTQLGVYTAKYNDTPLNPSGSTNNIRTVKSLVNNYRNLCPLIIVSGFKNLAEDLTYNFFSQVHELEAIALIGFLETQSDITALFDAGCDMVYSDTITPNEYD